MSRVGIESTQATNLIGKDEVDDSNEEDATFEDEGESVVQEEPCQKNVSDQQECDLTELHLFILEALHLPRLSSPW